MRSAEQPFAEGFPGTFRFLCMHRRWSICTPVVVHCAGNTNGGALVQCVVETKDGKKLIVTAAGYVVDPDGVIIVENENLGAISRLRKGDTFAGHTVSTVRCEGDRRPPETLALRKPFRNNTAEPVTVSVEVPGGHFLPAPRRNQPKIVKTREPYVMVFMEPLKEVASTLTDNEVALLCRLLPYYDYEGSPLVYGTAGTKRPVNIAGVAELTGWSRNRVSRTVQGLAEKGILKMVKAGTSNVLCLNPRYVWRGPLHTRDAGARKFEAPDRDDDC